MHSASLPPQARLARASGENLNYVTLAPQVRKARASGQNLNYMTLAQGEILNYSLSC